MYDRNVYKDDFGNKKSSYWIYLKDFYTNLKI